MPIWVDADACPIVIRDILFRAAGRTGIPLTLVANQGISVPPSPYIRTIRVNAGFDVADHLIVERMAAGDLVVTQDIPLAALVIEKGGYALSPRGESFSEANIRERLSVRNFMEELRSSGVMTGGPSALNQNDRQAFANQLDQYLHKHWLSTQGATKR